MPAKLRAAMVRTYEQSDQRRERNIAVLDAKDYVDTVRPLRLTLSATPDDIKDAAEYLASLCRAEASLYSHRRAPTYRAAKILGVDPLTGIPGDNLKCQIARVKDPLWWRRQIRKRLRRARENAWITAAPTKIKYCSADGLVESHLQNLAEEAWRGEHCAISNDGIAVDIPSTEKSTKMRYAEMHARTNGLAKLAQDAGLSPRFVTITCPAYMHPTTTAGGPRHKNDGWDGTGPGEAKGHLLGQWSKFRAWMKRRDIQTFWVRVLEPHTDSTPHMHIAMWAAEDEWDNIEKALRRYYLDKFAPDEPNAAIRRVSVERLRCGHKGAISYALKYAMKHTTGGDKKSPETEAAQAWRRAWGARAFMV